MSVFGAYARYYDLLYRDKNYAGEAAHIDSLIKANAPASATILELGCGSGGHAVPLADRGYRVHAIDISQDMLDAATARIEPSDRIRFTHGDARSLRLGETFDAVVSVFHVMSYQTTNDDLAAAFATARAHLKPGGVFVFDAWYGPAVLTDRPTVRVRRFEDDHLEMTRVAEPVMHATDNLVDVNYHVFLRDKRSGEHSEIKETHRMRYLFSPEIALALAAAGFDGIYAAEWMTGKPLTYATWNACFVARAR